MSKVLIDLDKFKSVLSIYVDKNAISMIFDCMNDNGVFLYSFQELEEDMCRIKCGLLEMLLIADSIGHRNLCEVIENQLAIHEMDLEVVRAFSRRENNG